MGREDASFLAESLDVTIESKIEPGITVDGDPLSLQRVAHNLVSKAVRDNHDCGQIECRPWRDHDGTRWTVANTGEPIPKADRERIFGRFEKVVSPSDQNREVGAGLCLNLVREIITAHGGSIRAVDSDEVLIVFEVSLDHHENSRLTN